MKPQLIPEWKEIALKLNSVQWSLVWATVVTTWMLTPEAEQEKMLSLLPAGLSDNMPALAVLAGFIGAVYMRLRAQPALHQDKP